MHVISSSRLHLIPLTPPVIRALLAGDYDGAGALLGVRWPADGEFHRDVLELRLSQFGGFRGCSRGCCG